MKEKEGYNMKLLDEILSDINLDKAIGQVVRNKGSNGVDKMSTIQTERFNAYRLS